MNKVSTDFFFFLVFSFLSTPFVFAQKIIPDQSVLTATLSGVKITEKAVKSITAYNVIRSGNVEYVAGDVIDLRSGFHVANGASFRARIEPVSQVNARVSSETSVEEGESKLVVTAYPNPFSNDTQIEYWLPENTTVNVVVYDEKGGEITRIIESQVQSKGNHKVTFSSEGLAAGTYLCVVNTARERKVQKIVKQ